jgi:hypothetical protein
MDSRIVRSSLLYDSSNPRKQPDTKRSMWLVSCSAALPTSLPYSPRIICLREGVCARVRVQGGVHGEGGVREVPRRVLCCAPASARARVLRPQQACSCALPCTQGDPLHCTRAGTARAAPAAAPPPPPPPAPPLAVPRPHLLDDLLHARRKVLPVAPDEARELGAAAAVAAERAPAAAAGAAAPAGARVRAAAAAAAGAGAVLVTPGAQRTCSGQVAAADSGTPTQHDTASAGAGGGSRCR